MFINQKEMRLCFQCNIQCSKVRPRTKIRLFATAKNKIDRNKLQSVYCTHTKLLCNVVIQHLKLIVFELLPVCNKEKSILSYHLVRFSSCYSIAVYWVPLQFWKYFFPVEKCTWFQAAAGPEEPREFFFLSVLVVYDISEKSVEYLGCIKILVTFGHNGGTSVQSYSLTSRHFFVTIFIKWLMNLLVISCWSRHEEEEGRFLLCDYSYQVSK